ncbi:MAG TPA: cbb3-type cytochrome c oxidase N-terminal domain-containing protein [Terriglobales bacterium]|nr:cbb3-type cytochrome c oxidase N-terminal domain-containing protein [Terriglobales bacterium]
MSDDDRDRLMSHGYDGIREYDNPLPGWWVWIFWVTIVFSLGYWAYYQIGPGPSVVAVYEAEMREAAARQPAAPSAGAVTDQTLLALQKNAGAMAKGKEIFAGRCVPCHGDRGQGIVGPNLTDDYWLHGGRPSEIYHTITEGVPEKGMVPWKTQLSPEEIAAVTAYVGTLHGTNPPNPKPPEGQKVAADGAPLR